ncbi:MAG: Ig-like domain-containing protein, partial [SAR324 cluster bacterium]
MYSIRKIISILRLVFILLLLLLNSCSDRSEFGTESDYIKLGADATVGGTDTTGDDNDTTVGGTDTTGDDNDTTEGATDTTEGASDTTAPTISSVSPTDNSTYKSPATTIAATFSEAMSTGTISTNTNDTTCSGSYQLSSDNFTTCIKMSAAPSSSNNATTFTATPTDNLSGGTIYKLKITTSAKDSSSNSLASTYTTNGFTTSPSGSGTITGTVKQGSSALSGVSVALSIYGTTVTTETSDSNGAFSQSSLGLGVYSLTYTKSGYLEAIQSGTLATDNQTLVVATQTMISDGCSDAGDISGTIKNAVTGDEIQGVAIILRNGLNTRSGNTISGKTATTD